MGCLVSRYYVEQLGGKRKVDRLLLMGGPTGRAKALTSLLVAPAYCPLACSATRCAISWARFPPPTICCPPIPASLTARANRSTCSTTSPGCPTRIARCSTRRARSAPSWARAAAFPPFAFSAMMSRPSRALPSTATTPASGRRSIYPAAARGRRRAAVQHGPPRRRCAPVRQHTRSASTATSKCACRSNWPGDGRFKQWRKRC